MSSNGFFMSVRQSDDTVVVTSRTASSNEFVQVRYIAAVKKQDPLREVPIEERGNVSEIEVNYVYVLLFKIYKINIFDLKKSTICLNNFFWNFLL